eukprot:SAG31_NODE_7898_length_1570_cov_1.360299_3_plen_231_part_00
MRRGWDKTYNYYGGGLNYYTKRTGGGGGSGRRLLMRGGQGIFDRTERYTNPEFYSGFMWQERVEQIITEHAALGIAQPLFMYYAFQNPHGTNLQVPEEYMAAAPCVGMSDEARQIYCGMVRLVDENVEKTHSLMSSLISEDFVLVFFADNGGSPTHGGYNMPLRGNKGSMFEGGVRSNSFVWKADLPIAVRGSTYRGLMHGTCALPRFLAWLNLDWLVPLQAVKRCSMAG